MDESRVLSGAASWKTFHVPFCTVRKEDHSTQNTPRGIHGSSRERSPLYIIENRGETTLRIRQWIPTGKDKYNSYPAFKMLDVFLRLSSLLISRGHARFYAVLLADSTVALTIFESVTDRARNKLVNMTRTVSLITLAMVMMCAMEHTASQDPCASPVLQRNLSFSQPVPNRVPILSANLPLLQKDRDLPETGPLDVPGRFVPDKVHLVCIKMRMPELQLVDIIIN
eukprot:gene17756-19528_t